MRTAVLLTLLPIAALAQGVESPVDPARVAAFDILRAEVRSEREVLVFEMELAGEAGAERPEPVGALGGAPVWSYVWPTTLDPSTVGFEEGAGLLALAATSHPDFDDTPARDENGDGDLANDGADWHVHWVVLAPTEACGPGALGVRDIPEGQTPPLPATWPGLPILIDSPEIDPQLEGARVRVEVPLSVASGTGFDGVTAALRVNESIHAPLLCVTDLFDVASGDLSLPGRVN